MILYCVNKNEQDTGEHEVHALDCEHKPEPENQIYLGRFNTCHEAINKAKEYYTNVDGCFYCSKECHTR